MADPRQRVPENVPGDFFVDATCIDCDACRQIAPGVFAEAATTSYVRAQPQSAAGRRDALYALLCCPTGSIGGSPKGQARDLIADFPLPVDGPVFYCGFNSPKSFGGNSYFVRRPDGNWLIDSPKFLGPLVKRLESLGGISGIFLTHADDVADAARYSRHFAAPRVIHRLELESQPDAEHVLDGLEPVSLASGVCALPTPGHTAGHCCLLIDNAYLFTGDHLDWNRGTRQLDASRNYCWYSWPQQVESMARLLDYQFEWVLPGHGQRIQLPVGRMHAELEALIVRMRSSSGAA